MVFKRLMDRRERECQLTERVVRSKIGTKREDEKKRGRGKGMRGIERGKYVGRMQVRAEVMQGSITLIRIWLGYHSEAEKIRFAKAASPVSRI